MDRMVENYIRCYCNYHQDNWDELLPAAGFACNSGENKDLGMSPFEMDLGWNPESPLDNLSDKEEKNTTLNEFKSNLETSLEDAVYEYKISKAGQGARSSIKYNPRAYKVGGKLWLNNTLFRYSYSKSQESNKLSSKRFGPFIVTRLIGKNAVELELPDHIKIPEVLHVSTTVPFYEQPEDIELPVPAIPDPVPTIEGAQ